MKENAHSAMAGKAGGGEGLKTTCSERQQKLLGTGPAGGLKLGKRSKSGRQFVKKGKSREGGGEKGIILIHKHGGGKSTREDKTCSDKS